MQHSAQHLNQRTNEINSQTNSTEISFSLPLPLTLKEGLAQLRDCLLNQEAIVGYRQMGAINLDYAETCLKGDADTLTQYEQRISKDILWKYCVETSSLRIYRRL